MKASKSEGMLQPMQTAVVNQKGGVGKTTVTVNCAYAAAEMGHRVLVVDLDPQANATSALLPDLDTAAALTTNDVLDAGLEGGALGAVQQTCWHPNLFVIPSELGLARREHDTSLALEFRLRTSLVGVADDYDLLLIDCPPNIGRLTVNALVAAENALLVSEAARASVQGLVGVMDTVRIVQQSYNPQLVLAGIVINRVEHTRETASRVAELDNAFGEMVFRQQIPKRAAIAEAYGACVPIKQLPGEGAHTAWDAIEAVTRQLLALSSVTVSGRV